MHQTPGFFVVLCNDIEVAIRKDFKVNVTQLLKFKTRLGKIVSMRALRRENEHVNFEIGGAGYVGGTYVEFAAAMAIIERYELSIDTQLLWKVRSKFNMYHKNSGELLLVDNAEIAHLETHSEREIAPLQSQERSKHPASTSARASVPSLPSLPANETDAYINLPISSRDARTDQQIRPQLGNENLEEPGGLHAPINSPPDLSQRSHLSQIFPHLSPVASSSGDYVTYIGGDDSEFDSVAPCEV